MIHGCGYAAASVVTSIYFALTSPSFESAVMSVVAEGGDTDTTGAITGAISGAMHGCSAIPGRWSKRLAAWNRFEDRVEALVNRPASFLPEHSIVDLEAHWTRLLEGRKENNGGSHRRRM